MKEISFPVSKNPNQEINNVKTERSIIVIGPNGSGKSRLGSWIEFKSEQKQLVHRVAAQKSLGIPKEIHPSSTLHSKKLLYYGYDNNNEDIDSWQYKLPYRWGKSPETQLLNDYGHLLTYLFSENYERLLEYTRDAKNTVDRLEPPRTLLDKVIEIWESVIFHRRLKIKSSNIEALIPNSDEKRYQASEMSDGERVVFYLIGECLAAPEKGIIIIDEPELHVHKSIQKRLWDEIEKNRSDCIFFYLTHDLDFASSRVGCEYIQMNSFDGENFDWEQIDALEDISNELLYEILGTRTPVLFIEGENGSYDYELYSLVYPGYIVKCVGSCSKVIEATKIFNKYGEFHNIKSYGIIDRDYRTQEELTAYEKNNIYCPSVAEVENLFLIEEVLKEVARLLYVSDPDKKVEEIKYWVIEEFKKYKEKFATEATAAFINKSLNSFNGKAPNISQLKGNFEDLKTNLDIDIESFYNDKLQSAEKFIEENNYHEILKVFNHKPLLKQVGRFFDIKPTSYTSKVKLICEEGNKNMLNELKKYLPVLV